MIKTESFIAFNEEDGHTFHHYREYADSIDLLIRISDCSTIVVPHDFIGYFPKLRVDHTRFMHRFPFELFIDESDFIEIFKFAVEFAHLHHVLAPPGEDMIAEEEEFMDKIKDDSYIMNGLLTISENLGFERLNTICKKVINQ